MNARNKTKFGADGYSVVAQSQDPVKILDQMVDSFEGDDSSLILDSQGIRPSSSVEAVNLNSWPTSSNETSPEQHKDKLGRNINLIV